MTDRFTQLGQFLLSWLQFFWQRGNTLYHRWYHKTYQPEQELMLPILPLTNQKPKRLGEYIFRTAAHSVLPLFAGFMTCILAVHTIHIYPTEPEAGKVFFLFAGGEVLFVAFVIFAIRDRAQQCLRQIAECVWDHPDIKQAHERYQYFYINEDQDLVFTNAKVASWLTAYPRKTTAFDWRQYQDNRFFLAIDWLVMSTWYLRFMWPFIISPMQLAFLAYWRAKRQVAFQPGMRVLMIGAGPLPYHLAWKADLGPTGSIVALDIDPYVNRTSHWYERTFEALRGYWNESRWVSEHVVGDAEELPFAADKFDIVVAIRCYHVNVEEGLRVLKPGGKLLIDGYSQVKRHDHTDESVHDSWRLFTA